MISQRQLAANRKNAQKSTGPKTPEGRAAVRLNGVKHGLTATTLVLPGERESDFESLLDSFEAEHRPATPTEEALVRQMVMAQWRLRRLYEAEAAFFHLRLIDTAEEAEEDYEDLDDAARLALVVSQDSGRSSVRENLSRIEARLERSFYKALRELQKMKNQTHSQNRTPEVGRTPWSAAGPIEQPTNPNAKQEALSEPPSVSVEPLCPALSANYQADAPTNPKSASSA